MASLKIVKIVPKAESEFMFPLLSCVDFLQCAGGNFKVLR